MISIIVSERKRLKQNNFRKNKITEFTNVVVNKCTFGRLLRLFSNV